MRSILIFLVVLSAFLPVRAEVSLEQRYLTIYVKINEAEQLERKNDDVGALKTFQDCYKVLTDIHNTDPTWQSALVGHRLQDCRAKILDLSAKTGTVAKVDASAQAPTSLPEGNGTASETVKTEGKKTSYPWKTQILTTIFWIGEDSSRASAWNENWTTSNHGADDPDNRNGFASATHASSVSPFYVALPFNDLAHPDKAKAWVPRAWSQRTVDGKPGSACKDRWVCIKSSSGHVCYAQWEDVGPDGNDKAEYVFGNDHPGGAGLDVSPAVAQYLGLDQKDKPLTSWRFVDDQDVPPGQWLKYDEQAVIYTALHQAQKTAP